MQDELVIAQQLPDDEAVAVGPGAADGGAVAVRVAVGAQRGGEGEGAAVPGVFEAGGHFVGEGD